MRTESIVVGNYYHVFNRGIDKKTVFFDPRDYGRFMFYCLFFQSPITHYNIGDRVSNFLRVGDYNISTEKIQNIHKNRYVDLVCFSIMPNHFHLVLGEKREGGISKIMQRSLDGYTRYFHTKYKKSGHVFEGPFRAVRTKDNDQLLYLSTYVHKNPLELKNWKADIVKYPWSSYQDYVGTNRWSKLLANGLIIKQFNSPKEYLDFTYSSTAKEGLDPELTGDL